MRLTGPIRRDAGVSAVVPLHEHLADLMIEAHADWRAACHSVHEAHRSWESATRAASRRAFELYTAALDQEECAAIVYADLVGRVEEPVASPS